MHGNRADRLSNFQRRIVAPAHRLRPQSSEYDDTSVYFVSERAEWIIDKVCNSVLIAVSDEIESGRERGGGVRFDRRNACYLKVTIEEKKRRGRGSFCECETNGDQGARVRVSRDKIKREANMKASVYPTIITERVYDAGNNSRNANRGSGRDTMDTTIRDTFLSPLSGTNNTRCGDVNDKRERSPAVSWCSVAILLYVISALDRAELFMHGISGEESW